MRNTALVCLAFLLLNLAGCAAPDEIPSQGEMQSSEYTDIQESVVSSAPQMPDASSSQEELLSSSSDSVEEDESWIRVEDGEGREVIFRLNDSMAADALYQQLPLSLKVEDFAGEEKIFYPDEALPVDDTPLAKGPAGTLAYYQPWADVAMFYGECSGADGLHALGEAVSGAEQIRSLSGTISIEPIEGLDGEETSSREETVPEQETVEADTQIEKVEEENMPALEIVVNGRNFSVQLYENETTAALLERLPLALDMKELNGNEKYVYLDESLPTDAQNPGQIRAGDLMLYGSDCLVLFYQDFSTSYSYTPLGRVEDPTALAETLGEGGIQAIIQISEQGQ